MLLVWVGGCVCETVESPMALGTRMAAATSTASSPVASNAHTGPRRFLGGGWPSAPEGWARRAASVGGRKADLVGGLEAPSVGGRTAASVGGRKADSVGGGRGFALVFVAGPLVPPAGGGA